MIETTLRTEPERAVTVSLASRKVVGFRRRLLFCFDFGALRRSRSRIMKQRKLPAPEWDSTLARREGNTLLEDLRYFDYCDSTILFLSL